MKNILIVEDQIGYKYPKDYSKLAEGIAEFIVFRSFNSAMRYIRQNKDNIDGIILDLGFANFECDTSTYNEKKGVELLCEMHRCKVKIPPVLIFSTTELDGFDLNTLEKIGISICDIDFMGTFDQDLFMDFIQNRIEKD